MYNILGKKSFFSEKIPHCLFCRSNAAYNFVIFCRLFSLWRKMLFLILRYSFLFLRFNACFELFLLLYLRNFLVWISTAPTQKYSKTLKNANYILQKHHLSSATSCFAQDSLLTIITPIIHFSASIRSIVMKMIWNDQSVSLEIRNTAGTTITQA